MNNLKNTEKTRFSSSYQPKNRGRKPKKLKAFSTKFDVSIEELKDIFRILLFDKSVPELYNLLPQEGGLFDNNIPAVVSLGAEVLLKEAERGKASFLIEIIEILFGKQKNIIEIQNPLDYEERKQLLADIISRETDFE